MTTPQRPRQKVRLPRDLHAQLLAIAQRRGHVTSALLHGWLVDAARTARSGGELPEPRPVPGASDGVDVRWTQNADEYRACADAINAAGSTVSAVLRTAIARYIASDGDLLADQLLLV